MEFCYSSQNLNDQTVPLGRLCLGNIQIARKAKDGGALGNFSHGVNNTYFDLGLKTVMT